MKSKLTSRKFWNAVVAEVVGIVTLIYGTNVGDQVATIAGAVILIAAVLGYLKAEKDVDVARSKEANNGK